MNRSVSDRIPCCELHYHGRIYLLDCGWDLSYLNVFLPPPAALRESKVVSPLDLPQLENPVVELNGGVFLNTDPFIISYALDRIDWASIDAIFVSTVGSCMLLPIILRETEFSGAIYAPRPLCEVRFILCE